MLETALQEQLRTYLVNLRHSIKLTASLDDSEISQSMQGMLEQIEKLSDQVTLELNGRFHLKPSFSIAAQGQTARVHFAGIPTGHEFTSLVLALLHVGGHPPKINSDLIEQIKNLKGTYQFETYVSLTCHNCPDVVQALNTMAALNPNIQHTMIDGSAFQSLVEEKKVMAVPSVFLNQKPFGQGRMLIEEIIAKLDASSTVKEAEKLSKKDPFDVLIVGGGPAGASAAIYAARKGLRTGLVTGRFGGQVMDTLGIENFISASYTEGPKLVAAVEEHVKQYDVDIMNLQIATRLSEGQGEFPFKIELQNGAHLLARTVILSTGANWRKINVPGEATFLGKGVAYCPHCDGPLFKGKRVAVIGGGNSGVEAAIDLAGVVKQVTLIEYSAELKADKVLQDKLFSLNNVRVITSAKTSEITGHEDKVNGLDYTCLKTNQSHHIELEGVFVQIGLLPNTGWLKDTLNLTPFGEIIVDAKGQTSWPGVFAAGDCTTTPFKQIIIAMGDGSKAALGAFDYLIRHTHTASTEVTA